MLPQACEASALLSWEGGWLVGDNEDKDELYAFDASWRPRPAVRLPTAIDDIEALVPVPDGYWVVGSHSRSKSGERRETRERLLSPSGAVLTVDFTACAECVAARELPPEKGGLNIEAGGWADGKLWLGLRSPLDAQGRALLLGLTSDGAVDQVVPVHLGGQGFRDLTPVGTGWLVVAGGVADGGAMTLWRMAGPRSAPEQLAVPLNGNVEGIALGPDGSLNFVTDGSGKPGKCEEPSVRGSMPFGG